MSYFGGSLRTAGDPGFFGALKGAVGGFFKGGPTGAVSGAVSGFRGSKFRPPTLFAGGPRITPVVRAPGIVAAGQRFFPGGATGLQVMSDGTVRKRRRRMNPTNPKALRRAIRRTDAFVNMAKGALKNTGFKIVSKSAGKMTEAAFQKRAHHAK